MSLEKLYVCAHVWHPLLCVLVRESGGGSFARSSRFLSAEVGALVPAGMFTATGGVPAIPHTPYTHTPQYTLPASLAGLAGAAEAPLRQASPGGVSTPQFPDVSLGGGIHI